MNAADRARRALSNRLRAMADTRFHRNPKTGAVWLQAASEKDQLLLDAAAALADRRCAVAERD